MIKKLKDFFKGLGKSAPGVAYSRIAALIGYFVVAFQLFLFYESMWLLFMEFVTFKI